MGKRGFMEFRKIDDQKFQCLLFEEDLNENNISIDDFFKNDTEKIHNLLDVVMEEAEKSIGMSLGGEVMSLQLAPQPNHSILLTISSGREDLNNMLKKAGDTVAKAFSKPERSNVIKNALGDELKSLPFEAFGDSIDKFETFPDKETPVKKNSNILKAGYAVFKLNSFEDFEHFCEQCMKTWGIYNSLYKYEKDNIYYLVLEKGRCAEEKYRALLNILMEYGEFDSAKNERVAWIKEHCRSILDKNAINSVKRYL